MNNKIESTDEAWESGLLGTSLEHAKPSNCQEVQIQYEGVVMLEFTGVPSRKVEKLLQDGWQVNGVSIERTNEDGTVSRGAVTTGGMVLWWNNEQDTADAARYGYIRQGNGFTVKCKKATIVHGPNPEKDYADALDKAIDEKIGVME